MCVCGEVVGQERVFGWEKVRMVRVGREKVHRMKVGRESVRVWGEGKFDVRVGKREG